MKLSEISDIYIEKSSVMDWNFNYIIFIMSKKKDRI